MKTILILVISILPFGMSAQINHIDYKVDCDVAYRMAIDDSDYSKCLGQLSKVNKKYGKLYCEEYILMAYCYKKMGKETKSAKCLRSAWSNYGFDMVCIDQIPQLNLTGINQGYGKKQKRIVQQGYDNFPKLNRINTDSLKIVFEKIEERDQGPRMKFYQDSVVDTIALNREMHLVDSLNLLEFRDIIYKVGYPGEWILPLNVSRVFVLLIHLTTRQSLMK